MWEIGGEDEILAKAWLPLITRQPPKNIAACRYLRSGGGHPTHHANGSHIVLEEEG